MVSWPPLSPAGVLCIGPQLASLGISVGSPRPCPKSAHTSSSPSGAQLLPPGSPNCPRHPHSLGGSCTEWRAGPQQPGRVEEVRPESLGGPEMSRPLTPGLWPLFLPHLFPLWVSLHASLSFCFCVSVFEPLLVSLLVSPSALSLTQPPWVSVCPSLSLRLSPCLIRWDTLLTGAQTPSTARPQPPPRDLRPFPTALSDFSSFKRHINYSNEVRRDPALCHPEPGTHRVPP